jgi:4-hydroxy-2-oxoglutarate aldolase
MASLLSRCPDIPTFEKHVAHVALAGAGPVIAGTMGESIHLSQVERTELVHAARRALDNAGLISVPIIVGTGSGSTRETLQLTKQAAAVGADYALIIASGYFAGALAANKSALKAYWKELAESSPIPVMIYNCESVAFPRTPTNLVVRSRSKRRHRLGFQHYN